MYKDSILKLFHANIINKFYTNSESVSNFEGVQKLFATAAGYNMLLFLTEEDSGHEERKKLKIQK